MNPPTFKEFYSKLSKRREVLERHGVLERWQVHVNAPAFKKLLEPDPEEEDDEEIEQDAYGIRRLTSSK